MNRMIVKNALRTGLALGAMLLWSAGANATFISYLTTGMFSGGTTPNTSVFTSSTGGTTVSYTSSAVDSATVPPTSNVSLGTLTVASTSTSAESLSGGFKLTIVDTTAGGTGGAITFTGTLSGAASSTASTGALVFSGPLTQQLDGVTFTITNADTGQTGRVNLAAPTTNSGQSTINAAINAVPEPSTLALLGLGIPAVLGLRFRRKMGASA